MSIDAITAKIVSDASEYADKLLSEAKAEANSIIAKAENEAGSIKVRMAELGAKDAVITKHRKQSAAELEARKMRLATKQKAVSDAVNAATDRLANMAPDAYISFLAAKIAQTNIKEGQLLLNAKDKQAVGDKLVNAANALLSNGKIILSDKTIPAKGGFILQYGAREINSTLETMVNSIREAVTHEVVAVLFQESEHEEV